jgi:hypothetical protein
MSNCGAVWSRPARPSTAAILATYKLRSSQPIISQIGRALWSSSIILSTSTVRKASWERSIDERRGRGEPEGALTPIVCGVTDIETVPCCCQFLHTFPSPSFPYAYEPAERSASTTTTSGILICVRRTGEQLGYIHQCDGWDNQELKQGRSLAIATRPGPRHQHPAQGNDIRYKFR